MKKQIAILFSFSVLIFASCKLEWETDFEKAQEQAKKTEKSILLNITSFETDDISKPLQEKVFNLWKFGQKYKKQFIFVNLDFSERMKMNSLGADATEDDVLAMQKILADSQGALEIAQKYAVRDLPTTLILSKDGFVVSRLNFFDVKPDFDPSAESAQDAKVEDIVDIYDFDKVCSTIDEVLPALEEFNARIKIADDETADARKRVDAINQIFDSTDFAYQRLLRRFSETVLKLDASNQSGTLGKHIISIALADDEGSDNAIFASSHYEKAAEHPALSANDKQFLYFQAATSFSRAQNEDSFAQAGGFDRIATLLDKSLAADPSSEFAPAIKSAIQDFKRWREEFEKLKELSENPQTQSSENAENAEEVPNAQN